MHDAGPTPAQAESAAAHSEPLYGPRERRDLPHAVALLTQAAQANRAGAAFLLGMLERTE